MNKLCLTAALMLAVIFSAVNLFIPYALLVAGLFLALGFSCGVLKKAKRTECPLGFC